MSARIPPGFGEAWWKFTIALDPEPMFISVGLDLAIGVVPDQTSTNNILNSATTDLAVFCTSEYTVTPSHVLYGQDGSDIRVDGTGAGVTGSTGTAAAPNNCATLVRKVTALGGRRQRGRLFIPGPAEINIGPSGTLTPATVTAYQTGIDNFRTTVLAAVEVDDLVLLHNSVPFTPTPITGLTVQNRIATQRRRMRP